MELKPNAGDRIELEINRSNDRELLASRVEEVFMNGIIAAQPIKKARYVHLRVDEIVTVIFKNGDYLYGIKSQVIGRKQKPIPMTVLKFVREPQKMQRRNFYRLETHIPVMFTIKEQEGLLDTEIEKYKGIVKDISGNGVCLVSDIKLNVGTVIIMRINLGEFGFTDVKGKVVRIYKTDIYSKYQLGIQFEYIDPKAQDSIIKYIFYQWRMLRRKGMV